MIQEKLAGFLNNESFFDGRCYELRDIEVLLNHFGNPHLTVPAIHIAGTNGKGSVAYMLNSIFSAAGYRTGLYTSPHLLEINERIILGNETIDDEPFTRYIDEIIEYTDSNSSIKPTYFDVLTAIAFRYFSDCHAEFAVIETGLGGRFDSTNVIIPLCSIITDISRDHIGILGNTIREIAKEKAGIIKERVPVITSNTDPESLVPILENASLRNSPHYLFSKDFRALNIVEKDSGYRFDYSLEADLSAEIPGIDLNHPLGRQIDNASCAITSAIITKRHFPGLNDNAIRNGIGSFSAPGRFQILCQNPMVIFDPAHNEGALKEMIYLLKRKFPDRAIAVIMSLMKDKDITGIMSLLAANGIKACYCVLNDQRCFIPRDGEYADVIIKIFNSEEKRLYAELDRRISADSLFFFTGSFRLYRTALTYAGHICTNCS